MAAAAAHSNPITRRVIGFIQHLRLNGFVVGPADTETALVALSDSAVTDAQAAGLRLKILLSSRQEEWSRFDELFEAYWFGRGQQRTGTAPSGGRSADWRPEIWSDHLPDAAAAGVDPALSRNSSTTPTGRPAASLKTNLARTDLRHIADPREIAAAETLAVRLARAMTYRLSRRFRFDTSGAKLDLRRIIRHSIAHGGEPIELARKDRPDRPVEIVLLVDVSGSMKPYSRFFLQFMKGMVRGWKETDAYLFHTSLVRVTDALRERDPMTAMTRLTLMAEGFGGGTRLAESLRMFNTRYAKRALSSRSVVIIISDGYDTGSPLVLAAELTRLKKRARRLVWLNPLLGWIGYEPVSRAMQAAMPFIDHFAAAHSLQALSGIEGELRRL